MKLAIRTIGKLFAFAAIAYLLLPLTVAVLSGCTAIQQEPPAESRADINSDDQTYLANYGDWTTVEPYGEVWRPRVTAEWEPFHYGQWVWSDQGWVWESYEPYGWLVYHHGNWCNESNVGWFWVPSQTWSAAPVQWTQFGDYVGWAPAPPPGVILPTPWSPESPRIWHIVEARNFSQENVGKYKVVKSVTTLAVGAPVNDRTEPDVKVVERFTKKAMPAMKVQRQETKMGSREYFKLVLPEPDAKRVKAETAAVEKNVLQKKPVRTTATVVDKKSNKKDKAKDTKSDEEKKQDSEPKKSAD